MFEPSQEQNISILRWVKLSDYDLDCVLCGALDSACGESWQWVEGYRLADGKTKEEYGIDYKYDSIFLGGAFEIKDDEGIWHRVDRDTLIKACRKFASQLVKAKRKVDFDQFDAIDCDAILQLAVFGEIIYG